MRERTVSHATTAPADADVTDPAPAAESHRAGAVTAVAGLLLWRASPAR